jgi:dihydroneopterin aldolase
VIELHGLRLDASIGVLPEERTATQPIEIDLDLDLDTSAAGASDDLADTVDYGAVCDAVEALVGEGHVQLLEALAERITSRVLLLDPRLTAVTVAVRKLRPPVPQELRTSGVRITRRR